MWQARGTPPCIPRKPKPKSQHEGRMRAGPSQQLRTRMLSLGQGVRWATSQEVTLLGCGRGKVAVGGRGARGYDVACVCGLQAWHPPVAAIPLPLSNRCCHRRTGTLWQ
jgi:hypothetical protein